MSRIDQSSLDTTDAYRKGMAAFNNGRMDEAAGHLVAAAEASDLEGCLARFYLGQAHFRMGLEALESDRYQAAVEHFRQAHSVGVGGLAASRYLAACHVALERYVDAAAELEGLLGRDNDRVGVRTRLAMVRWKMGQSDVALECLAKGIDAQPQEPALHYQLGTMLAAREQYGPAVEAFRTAIRLAPEWVEAHVRLSWCYAAMDRHDLALKHLEKAHALRPGDIDIAVQLRLAKETLGGQSRPSSQPLVQGVAGLSLKDADVSQLEEIIAREPEFVEAFLSLPTEQLDTECLALLAAAIERAIQRHPRYADLHLYCSRVYERMGLAEAAIAESERAVEINPRYIRAMAHMGRLFEATDRRQEAIDRLEAALEAGAEDANIHCVLGNLYRASGQLDRARDAYECALRLDAGLLEAREGLKALAA